MGTDESQNTALTHRSFAILLTALLLSVIGAAAVVSAHTSSSTSFTDVMSVVSTLASISLSAILAYLYYRMRGIQDKQQDIMANQEQIMEAEHFPHIFFEHVEMSSEGLSAHTSDDIADAQLGFEKMNLGRFSEDVVEVSLLNAGNGPATDMRLNIRIVGENTIKAESIKEPLSRYNKTSAREKDQQRRRGSNHQDFIKAGASGEFWVRPQFPVFDGRDTVKVPFGVILDLCKERDVEVVDIEIEFLYRDMTNQMHRELINRASIETSEIGRSTRLADIFMGDAVDRGLNKEYSGHDVFYSEGSYMDWRLAESLESE